MLIEHIYPVMKTYQFKGCTIGYKGDILKIEQDIGGWIQRLQSLMPSNTTVAYLSSSKQPTLPEDDSVEGQVNIVEEEELGQDAQNISTAARDTNKPPIQVTLGPEQGGASGVNAPDEDQIIEG
eukprot:13511667-Ditylum_brightwellii.AAC.1